MDSLPRSSPPSALSCNNESTAAVLLEPLSASETSVPPLSTSEKTVLFSAKLAEGWPAGFQQADDFRSRVSVKLPEVSEVLNPFSPSVCAAPSCPAHRHRVTIGTTSMPADPIQQAEGHASKLNELIAGSIERARANSTPVAPRAAAETPPKPAMLRQLTLEVPSLSNTVAATALLEAAFAPPLPEDLCRTRIESSCLRLVGKLGNGSFGTVYDARWYRANDIDIAGTSPEGASSHTTTSPRPPRRVAVKLLHTKVLAFSPPGAPPCMQVLTTAP